MEKISLKLTNDVSELLKIHRFLDELTELWNLKPKLVFNLNLVLEELFSNVVFYAYNDDKKHEIELIFTPAGNVLQIDLKDDGTVYNPLDREENIILNQKLEDKKIGGLGIYLVKNIVDEISYNRQNNYNIVTLKMNIDS